MIRSLFCIATLNFALISHAELSPLSVNSQGWGMPVAAMGARERGMGEGGLAALSSQGYYLPNASRSAYLKRTSFVATMDSDLDWLQDDKTSNRKLGYGVPTIGTFIKTQKFGTYGLHLQQAYARSFEVTAVTSSGIEQKYTAEGGLYLLGFSWGYAPIPLFAIGFAQDFAFGRDRFIDAATLNGRGGIPDVGGNLTGDTLEMRQRGSFPTLSVTLHTHLVDAAIAYSIGDDFKSSNERRVSGLSSNPVSESSRQWPTTVALGLGWKISPNQTATIDFKTEEWTGVVLNRAFKTSAGYEFRGSENPFEDFYKRISWRGGAGHEILYLQEASVLFGTIGLGLPLGQRGHGLDFSVKYGHLSYEGTGAFTEDYVRISASVVGVAIWGQPIRKRR